MNYVPKPKKDETEIAELDFSDRKIRWGELDERPSEYWKRRSRRWPSYREPEIWHAPGFAG